MNLGEEPSRPLRGIKTVATTAAVTLLLGAGACTERDSGQLPTSETVGPGETQAPATAGIFRVQDRGPGVPDVVTDDRSVQWAGGPCIDLYQWENGEWTFLAYADFDDAVAGTWGPPVRPQTCDMVLVGGDILLPTDTGPGTYRLCLSGQLDHCVQLQYSPQS